MKTFCCASGLAWFALVFTTGTCLILPERRVIVTPTIFLPDLTEVCLGCICEATTNCNLTIGCWRGRCGPLLISKQYWEEAGRPVLRGDHPANLKSFFACVNDSLCAARTVKQYMGRYLQDCNGDGILDCDDYARIHYLGGRQCTLPIEHYGYYKLLILITPSESCLSSDSGTSCVKRLRKNPNASPTSSCWLLWGNFYEAFSRTRFMSLKKEKECSL